MVSHKSPIGVEVTLRSSFYLCLLADVLLLLPFVLSIALCVCNHRKAAQRDSAAGAPLQANHSTNHVSKRRSRSRSRSSSRGQKRLREHVDEV